MTETVETNLALARRAYELWNTGGVDAFRRMWAADIVFREMPELPETGVFRDADELADHLRGISSAGHPHFEVLALEGCGDWVLATLDVSVRGASSGAATKTRFFQLWRFEGDRVREFRSHLDGDRARGEYNVALFRTTTEAFNARDLDRFLAYFDPDVEYHSSFSGVGTVYRGHEGMRKWHQDLEDAWGAEIRSEPRDYFYTGDYTITIAVLRARGRHSEVEVEMPDVLVARWNEGSITFIKSYDSTEEALSQLGLSASSLEPCDP